MSVQIERGFLRFARFFNWMLVKQDGGLGVPEAASAWPTWTDPECLAYALDWDVARDQLQMLREWSSAGSLNPEQVEALRELEALIAKNGPLLHGVLQPSARL